MLAATVREWPEIPPSRLGTHDALCSCSETETMTSNTTRFLPRAALMVAFVAATSLVAFDHNPAAAQAPNLQPTYGWLKLRSGFNPDPVGIEVEAGGDNFTQRGGVKAHVADAPDFSI